MYYVIIVFYFNDLIILISDYEFSFIFIDTYYCSI